MAQRPVLAFLIKIVPVFFGLLWLWHSLGVSVLYHRLLAGFLDTVYPALDATDIVHGVSVQGHELLLKLRVGNANTGLAINGEDVTSNFAMLAALYLSSPILPRWRLFLICFAAAFCTLFLLHAVTVWSLGQYAFAGHPQIAPLVGLSAKQASLLAAYNSFFESMGMYLYALILWLPYILVVLHDHLTSAAPQRQTADPR